MGHRSHPVEPRSRKRINERSQGLSALLFRAIVTGHQEAHSLSPELFRERRTGEDRLEPEEDPELLRRARQELAR